MSKKLKVLCLLLTGFLFIANAYAMYYPYGIEINPTHPLRLGHPILIGISGYINEQTDITVTITLPTGLQLLRGELQMTGKFNAEALNGGYSVCEESLYVQINHPGTYEISVVMTGKKLQTTSLADGLPLRKSCFLYAREDTVVYYYDRVDLDKTIRDSSIAPREVLDKRRMDNIKKQIIDQRMQEWADRAEKHKPPLVVTRDLREISRAYHLLETHYHKWYNLSMFYNPDQAKLIERCDLMTAPPELEKVDSMLVLDCHGTLNKEQMQKMSQLLKKQLNALYDIDQQIILSKPMTEQRAKLFGDRSTMLIMQTFERQELVNKKQ